MTEIENRSIGSTIWRYSAATILSGANMFSAAGQTIWGMKTIYAYFDDAWNTPVSTQLQNAGLAVATTCSVVVNLFTRTPNVFDSLTSHPQKKNPALSQTDNEIQDEEGLTSRAFKFIYYSITFGSGFYSLWNSVSGYLYGENSVEYAVNIDTSNSSISTETQAGVSIAASLIALGMCYNTFTYRFPPIVENAKIFAAYITDPDMTFKEKIQGGWQTYRWTLAKSSFNIISVIFQSYFATISTFKAIGLANYINATLLSVMAGTASTCAFISNLFSTVPSTHKYMNPSSTIKEGLKKLPLWGKIYYLVGKNFGRGDSIFTGLGATVAIIVVTNTVFSAISLNSIPLLVAALICGGSIAYTSQAFGVNMGLIKRLMKWYPDLFKDKPLMNTLVIPPPNLIISTVKTNPFLSDTKHSITIDQERKYSSSANVQQRLSEEKNNPKQSLLKQPHKSYQSSDESTPISPFDGVESSPSKSTKSKRAENYSASAPEPFIKRLLKAKRLHNESYDLMPSTTFLDMDKAPTQQQTQAMIEKHLAEEEMRKEMALNNLIMNRF